MSETIAVDEALVQRLPTPLVKLIRRAQNAKTPLDSTPDAHVGGDADDARDDPGFAGPTDSFI